MSQQSITQFFKEFKQIGFFNWLAYHINVQFKLAWIYCPLRFRSQDLPLFWRPGLPIITFVFAMACSLMFLLPIILLLGQIINQVNPTWGVLVILVFWLFFSVMFRSIQSGMDSYIVYDGKSMTITRYGLLKKNVITFQQEAFNGLYLLSKNYYNTANHKVCIVVKDGRKILLYLSTSQKRSAGKIQKWNKFFRLPLLEQADSSEPINNIDLTSRFSASS